jgi:Transmembrane secretion effector
MSIYQMALMGGSAAGAAAWGQVASVWGVPVSLLVAAALGPVVLLFTRKLLLEGGNEEDLRAAPVVNLPQVLLSIEPEEGPVMVTVEYQIDPVQAADFHAVMEETRQARLRQGALSWGLFRDTAVPGRYIEYFVDETWVEHQRRHERFTAGDVGLRERRAAFQQAGAAPTVRRYVAEPFGC